MKFRFIHMLRVRTKSTVPFCDSHGRCSNSQPHRNTEVILKTIIAK